LNLALDELINENDVVVEITGIKVVYSEQLENSLKYAVIDYSDKWYRRGFQILGGNMSSC